MKRRTQWGGPLLTVAHVMMKAALLEHMTMSESWLMIFLTLDTRGQAESESELEVLWLRREDEEEGAYTGAGCDLLAPFAEEWRTCCRA